MGDVFDSCLVILSNFTIMSLRERELVAFLYLCSFCRVAVHFFVSSRCAMGWSVFYGCCIFFFYFGHCFEMKMFVSFLVLKSSC